MESLQLNEIQAETKMHLSEETATQMQDEEQSSMNIQEEAHSIEVITENQIRSAVLSCLDSNSLKWTMKSWRENVMKLLNIAASDSDLKERLKTIVHEEALIFVRDNLNSQAQEDVDREVIGDNGEVDDEMDVLDESTQRQNDLDEEDEAVGEEDENYHQEFSESTQPQVIYDSSTNVRLLF